jgi:hypothetical protein
LEAVKAIFRGQNLDAEFLEPTFQQLGRARIGVYDPYARRRRNLFEIVSAPVPRDCLAFIAGQQVYQRFAHSSCCLLGQRTFRP